MSDGGPPARTGVRPMPVRPMRIQLSRKAGWRMPANTVKVDRTTRFGNHAGRGAGTPQDAVAAFRRWVECDSDPAWRAAARALLKGKNLACWCRPGEPCHADVLIAWLGDAQG
jgi:hypothetical protein